jgi:uncharacterized protein (DUF2336 family)
MIIRTYLDWSRNATVEDRALAVGILAELYLAGDLSDEDRHHAEAALTLVLDDHALPVRKTLAEALGACERVPRHIIIGLLQDHAEVAQIVIANSPVLQDHELVACLKHEVPMVHVAVAQRNLVAPEVSAAIAERGDITAILALLENNGAEIREASIHAMIDRFGEESALRELLLNRPDLPVDIRMMLVDMVTRQLVGFAARCGWLSSSRAQRVQLETAELGSLVVAAEASPHEILDLVLRLRTTGQLTPQLLLRSLLCGDTRLLIAALADLAGVSTEKASGFVQGRSVAGFRALYRKAGMPVLVMPAFEAALVAWHQHGADLDPDRLRLSLRMVESVLTSMAVHDPADQSGLLVLLGRFQAEAARQNAHERIASILATETPKIMLDEAEIEKQLSAALELEFKLAA